MENTNDTTPPQTAGAPGSTSGEIVHRLTHGEPEGWPDPVAMQEAWEREDAIELVTDKRIARKYADSIIEWIAGPVPWQESERVDMTDAILRAIHEAKGIAPSEQNKASATGG